MQRGVTLPLWRKEKDMSTVAVKQVILKALSDDVFRRNLSTNPNKSLSGFDLNEEEKKSFSDFDRKVGQLYVKEEKKGLGMAM
jgi:hypothetical protein